MPSTPVNASYARARAKITNQGNVVVKAKRLFIRRTMRKWLDNGSTVRDPNDADVEETPDDGAKEERHAQKRHVSVTERSST